MLSDVSDNSVLFDTEDVEVNSLGEWSALSDGNDVTFLNSETRRAVGDDVSVSLLISVILFDVVEIVSSDNESVLHLVGDDHGSKDFSSNADIASEWTLLVNIVSLDGLFGSFESKTDVSEISDSFSSFGDDEFLVAVEYSGLFLISLFFLFDHV